MPLYEYECSACGNRFERIQKFSDPPVQTCPECGGEVHKLIAAPAVQFKGSGWYVTDYAGKGKEPRKDAKETKDGKESTESAGRAEGSEKSAETAKDTATRDTSNKETKTTKDGTPSPPAKS